MPRKASHEMTYSENSSKASCMQKLSLHPKGLGLVGRFGLDLAARMDGGVRWTGDPRCVWVGE